MKRATIIFDQERIVAFLVEEACRLRGIEGPANAEIGFDMKDDRIVATVKVQEVERGQVRVA